MDRYLFLSLPGAALAATAAAAYFLPTAAWKPAALAIAAYVVVFMGGVPKWAPRHHDSGWRETASTIHSLDIRPDTPILYPSPFIEALSPVWKTDYTLPGFLYCQVEFYPVGGTPYLLPFTVSPEAERYGAEISSSTLALQDRFLIYGGHKGVNEWEHFFSGQPQFGGWSIRQVAKVGDVEAVAFENPHARASEAGKPGRGEMSPASAIKLSQLH